jgi:hypothetical protein
MSTVSVQYSFPIHNIDEKKAFIHPDNITTALANFERDANNGLTSAFLALQMIRHIFLEQFAVDTIVFRVAFHTYCQILIRIEYQYQIPPDVKSMMRDAIRVATQYYPLLRGFRPQLHLYGEQSIAYVKAHVKKDTRMRWRAIKFAVMLLGLHSRATVTANHPDRKRDRKEFMCT